MAGSGDLRYVRSGVGRRAAGWALDLGLAVLTLGVGWLIALGFCIRRGQTPGKVLLGMWVVHDDGTTPSLRTLLVREIILKYVVGALTLELSTLVAGGQAAWAHRTWWDLVTRTMVVQRAE